MNDPAALSSQGRVRIPRERRLAYVSTRRVFQPPPPRLSRLEENDDGFSDVVLPSQFFTPSRGSHAFWHGEQRLLFAVLQDAVACWFRYCEERSLRERRIFAETYNWFWSEEKGWLFAFERICELLDLDPGYIRRGLLRWRAKLTRRETFAAGVRRTPSSQLSARVSG
jgi:hypothetical protein